MSSFVRHNPRPWKRMSNLYDRTQAELWHAWTTIRTLQPAQSPEANHDRHLSPRCLAQLHLGLPPNFSSAPFASFLRAMCNKTFAYVIPCGCPSSPVVDPYVCGKLDVQ